MTTEQYLEHKKNYLDILNDIINVENFPKEIKEKFEESKRKLQEDEFNIALIGEFQGGKSTTIDALCDGREISPRGNNMKTSACRIKVSNIIDGEEHAVVSWKSNTELVLTISSILDKIDRQSIGFREEDKKPFVITEYLNLENPNHMNEVKMKIKEKWETAEDDDERDILLIAEFIVNFNSKTKQLRQRTDYGIDEIKHIMTFPDKMGKRFNKDGIKSFSAEEALFAFVQSVHCFIHSEALQRLGCTFIDCPGLFASEYDTSIAIQTLTNSDATLYLIGGEKEMGKDEKRSLYEISKLKRIGLDEEGVEYDKAFDNLFFALNQRKSDYETSFVEDNLDTINKIGFNKVALPKFDALLFYLASFGDTFLKGRLDEQSMLSFLQRYEYHLDKNLDKQGNVNKIWTKAVNQHLSSVDIDHKVPGLDIESVNWLFSICGANVIFDSIEKYVINKKAYSILVDNGAIPIDKQLNTYAKQLREREKNARQDVMQKEKEYKKAESDYNKFKEEVGNLLEDSFPQDTVIKPFVNAFYSDYIKNQKMINDVSLEITKDLVRYVKTGTTYWKGTKLLFGKAFNDKLEKEMEERIRNEITPFFQNAFRKHMSPIIRVWAENLLEGKDNIYNLFFVPELNRISEQVENKWKAAIMSSSFFSTIQLNSAPIEPKKLTITQVDGNLFVSKETILGFSNIAAGEAGMAIVDVLVTWIISGLMISMVDFLGTGGFFTIIGAIWSLIIYFVWRKHRPEINSVDDLKKKQLNLYNAIANSLGAVLSDEVNQNQICFENKEKAIVIIPESIANGYRKYYEAELESIKKKIDRKIQEERRLFQGLREELIRISNEAKEQREDVIEPLRKRIKDFISSIKNG